MRSLIASFILSFILIFSAHAQNDDGQLKNIESVTALASSSLTLPISQISKLYSREKAVDVNAVFENSSSLLRRIEEGDPADIVITPSAEWMDKMQEKGLIDASSRVILAKNRISLVASKVMKIETKDKKLEDLLDFIHSRVLMVIAEPDNVELGDLSSEIIRNIGKWRKYRKFLVLAPTSTKTVDYIIKSETAGLIFTTDAILYGDKLEHLGVVPQKLHSPIEYHAALVVGNNMVDAGKYLAFLSGKQAKAVFKSNGFVIK